MTNKTQSSPKGRRPGLNETRAAIVSAAQCNFAQHGYSGASLRSIAREAGVDPALISHFFGSKARLFVSVVKWPIDPDEATAKTLASGRSGAGRRLALVFLEHWRSAENRSPIIALITAATADPAAAELLHDFLMEQLLLPLLDALGSDQRTLRASLISAQLMGLGLSRYVLGLADPAKISDAQIVDALGPTLQRYLVEPLT